MSIYLKCAAVVLVTLILHLVLLKGGKDFSSVLTIAACCTVLVFIFSCLEPFVDFLTRLQNLAKLDSGMLSIIIKSVGLGILTEIISAFCSDAGNAALGKTLQVVTAFVILLLSIPLFEALIALVEEILVTI